MPEPQKKYLTGAQMRLKNVRYNRTRKLPGIEGEFFVQYGESMRMRAASGSKPEAVVALYRVIEKKSGQASTDRDNWQVEEISSDTDPILFAQLRDLVDAERETVKDARRDDEMRPAGTNSGSMIRGSGSAEDRMIRRISR